MHPTDRGMCCSFNKQKADEMFKESRYQENIVKLTEQDKKFSFEDSKVPDWWDVKHTTEAKTQGGSKRRKSVLK